MEQHIRLKSAILIYEAFDKQHMEIANYESVGRKKYKEVSRETLSIENMREIASKAIVDTDRFNLSGNVDRNIQAMKISNSKFTIAWMPKNISKTVKIGNENFVVTWPKIILTVKDWNLHIQVVHRKKKYNNPFPNSVANAGMCFGNIEKKYHYDDFQDFFDSYERYFYDTAFTHSNKFLDSCISGVPNYSLITTEEHAFD